MLQSYKSKLIFSFLFFSLISVVIIVINRFYNNERENIENIISVLNKMQINHLNDQKSFRDYLYIDTGSSNYFEEHESMFLNTHDSLTLYTQFIIDNLLSNEQVAVLKVSDMLHKINSDLDSFRFITKSITKHILLRGFKDYGNTGKMREYAHKLENYDLFPKEYLLMLRRHEKDFIIRGEQKYSNKFYDKYKKYRTFVVSSKKIDTKNKKNILADLDNYKLYFDTLLIYSNIIGDKKNTGLYYKLNNISQELQNDFMKIKILSEKEKEKFFRMIHLYYIITLVLIISISIIAGIILSNKITKPITILSERINSFVSSNFTNKSNFSFNTKTPEIKNLINNYFILKDNIIGHIENLQEKVSERTQEIERQKEYILNQNNDLIREKQKIEAINNNIYAGLNYAQYVQNSLLPDTDYIKQLFKDSFIYHRAKDVVSGDFYWVNKFNNPQGEELVVFAVADATGHGVSGALMSMLGITFLNEITNRNKGINASHILSELRTKVNNTMKKNENKNQLNNGMDIALFILNKSKFTLQFAGAHRPIWIIKNKEFIEFKGDSIPIGGYIGAKEYTNHNIQLEKGDKMYLYTDGYTDQFGGEVGTKFKKKYFKELLQNIYELPMKKQLSIIESVHVKWKNGNKQTDDILVVGLQV